MFPSPVHPEVLVRLGSNGLFQGVGVFLGDPSQRVVPIGPLMRVDNLLRENLEAKPSSQAPAAHYGNGGIKLHRHQGDRLERAGRSTEKVHEHASPAGVLVADSALARRSQIPMLAAMILFSILSLWLLKQPMEMRTSAM